jgi:small subunit ribosomal protein S11
MAEEKEQVKEQAPAADNAKAGDVAGAAEGAAADGAVRKVKVKAGRVSPVGTVHIRSTFNNTTVSITDVRGGAVSWSSAGRVGFHGSRKSTAFAATLAAQDAAKQAVSRGMNEVEIKVQGAGAGRESAIRGIQSAGLNITVIKDVTPIPHNGCRPRKRRRV